MPKKATERYQCADCGDPSERHPMFNSQCWCGGRIVIVTGKGDVEYYAPNPYALPKRRMARKPLPGQLELFDNHPDGADH